MTILTGTSTCMTCWALVPQQMAQEHDDWHDRIARVAIESTQQIDALTHRIQEIEASYR